MACSFVGNIDKINILQIFIYILHRDVSNKRSTLNQLVTYIKRSAKFAYVNEMHLKIPLNRKNPGVTVRPISL